MSILATNEKKRIIGAKVSKEEKEKILGRCNALKCTTTDYIKKLIDIDLAWPTDGNTARVRFEGNTILLPCVHCGGPVPFNLKDLRLARI